MSDEPKVWAGWRWDIDLQYPLVIFGEEKDGREAVTIVPTADYEALLMESDHLIKQYSPSARLADAFAAALEAIIARADNHELGTSKVQDMRRIADEALKGTDK